MQTSAPLRRRLLLIPLTLVLVLCVVAVNWTSRRSHASQSKPVGVPENARVVAELGGNGVVAYVLDQRLWLQLEKAALERNQAVIPRVAAAIRTMRWKGHPDVELKFSPEPREWIFSWKSAPVTDPVIEVVFDTPPVALRDSPPAVATGDGSVMVWAYQASTFGEKLRYEPQPFKNTVGYWVVPGDYATWDIVIDQPGAFTVALLQGCGEGQGGSDAVISLRQSDAVKAELPFRTIDTGHFQNFRWNHLGSIQVTAAGQYQLRIQPAKIAKNALFDVRGVHLVRQATAK
ncbi:MAG: hypothetical protein NT069_02590 [Planctomycetota bacterium]|nr:hypothetical protein [Planctomycetota bacterium]